MGLSVKVNYPRPNIPASQEKLHEFLTRELVEAAKTWVINTTDVVPVLTGASKASFLKLAAQANTTITISPIEKSRIPLGFETSVGELIVDPGRMYAFTWQSDLDYIHIVDERSGFLSAGQRALDRRAAQTFLPPPVIGRGSNG